MGQKLPFKYLIPFIFVFYFPLLALGKDDVCKELLGRVSNPELKEKITILDTILPSESETEAKPNESQIPNFAIVRLMFSEHLVVLKDPNLDPNLFKWLEKMRKKFSSIKDPLEKAEKISQYIAKTFRHTGHTFLSPFKNKRFNNMTERDYVLIGDFIKNGTGVCRHQAALLQIALQDQGIASEIAFGKLKEITLPAEVLYEVAHAWVEVIIDGNIYIFDPAQNLNNKISILRKENESSTPHRIITTEKWGDRVEFVYKRQLNSALNKPRPLRRSDIENILPAL